MAEAGNNNQNSNEGQQNTSICPQPFTDMQIHLMIRNDIELFGKFSVSPSPCADKGNGGTGGALGNEHGQRQDGNGWVMPDERRRLSRAIPA